ncbi:hypothetical protein [Parvicella tangerina]|uniref:Uncharacterized protein n=1 Tax=Parvicella tangerina TaxID=2829795 RepID=A0A916NRB7_9FLAO|nr:hypothetical protein [Parvicella tangerina]CAG5080791.1 hypothetical protein CRYO30217_01445 [Parvicella tangerina]
MEWFSEFFNSRSVLPFSLGVGAIIWGLYTKYIPSKTNAIVVASILITFVIFTAYLMIVSSLGHYAIVLIPINIFLTYTFYWIFIKDDGENRKLL